MLNINETTLSPEFEKLLEASQDPEHFAFLEWKQKMSKEEREQFEYCFGNE